MKAYRSVWTCSCVAPYNMQYMRAVVLTDAQPCSQHARSHAYVCMRHYRHAYAPQCRERVGVGCMLTWYRQHVV